MQYILIDANDDSITRFIDRESVLGFLQSRLDDEISIEECSVLRINEKLSEVKIFYTDTSFEDDEDYATVSLVEYNLVTRNASNSIINNSFSRF